MARIIKSSFHSAVGISCRVQISTHSFIAEKGATGAEVHRQRHYNLRRRQMKSARRGRQYLKVIAHKGLIYEDKFTFMYFNISEPVCRNVSISAGTGTLRVHLRYL